MRMFVLWPGSSDRRFLAPTSKIPRLASEEAGYSDRYNKTI